MRANLVRLGLVGALIATPTAPLLGAAGLRWDLTRSARYRWKMTASGWDRSFQHDPDPKKRQTVTVTGELSVQPGGKVVYANQKAEQPGQPAQRAPDTVYQGLRADGTIPAGQAKEAAFELLFRLPEKALMRGEVAVDHDSQPGQAGAVQVTIGGERRVENAGNVQVGKTNLTRLVVSADLTHVTLPPRYAGDCDCWVRADAVVLFDEATGQIGAAWGRSTFVTDADLVEAGEVTHTIERKDALPGPGSMKTRTRQFAGMSQWVQIVRRDLPDELLPTTPFVNAADFRHQIRVAALRGEGIPFARGGRDRKGLAPERYVAWSYAQLGAEAPVEVGALAEAGAPVEDPAKIAAGDVLVFRKDSSPEPAFVALALGAGELAYIHPGKEWRRLPVDHPAFASRYLGARRLVALPD